LSVVDILEPTGERMLVAMEEADAPSKLIVAPEISRRSSRIGRVVKAVPEVPHWLLGRMVLVSPFAGHQLSREGDVDEEGREVRMMTPADVVALLKEG
jgi:hypothetical protein